MYFSLHNNALCIGNEDTETEFARLLNEESEAEKSRDNRLARSNRGAEDFDMEEDYIPVVAKQQSTVEKVRA